jgi:copper(I)-binding protein
MHFKAVGGGYGRLLGRGPSLAVMLAVISTVGAGAIPARGADSVPVHAGDSAPVHAAEVAPVVEAAEAWVRWLPADLPAAGYVTLTNKGPTTLELVGASSPDYAEVSMHQTLESHGMSEMRPVASLVLKPQATVRFAEGGYHLMLMHATRQLHQHDRVEIVFRFSDGRTMPVPFEVRSGLGG